MHINPLGLFLFAIYTLTKCFMVYGLRLRRMPT
jgi:hypothetical protein